jgi:hypothetical protein
MAKFTYQPLDLDRPAVRFVRILAGYPTDPIQCEIFQGWIEEYGGGMPYEALSYTWGSVEKTAIIEVDKSTMLVTTNLYQALQRLRFGNQDRILWVDAICIDQDNMEERRHQVQHMSDIYKNAECVLVWLGEGNEESDFAMDAIKPLEQLAADATGDWRGLAQHLLGLDVPINLETLKSRRHRIGLQRGTMFMLGLPWFRRIWVLQEAANARVAVVLCGQKSVSTKVFAQVPSMLGLDQTYYRAVLDIMPGFSRTESWWKQNRSLLILMKKFRSSQATDARDMVYALLGLSSDAGRSGVLLPDYTKNEKQVVQTTVSYLLLPTNHNWSLLDFLDWDMSAFLTYIDLEITKLRNIVLQLASRHGRMAVVELLLESTDWIGRTIYFLPYTYGNKAVTKLLLESDGEVEQKDRQD